VNTIIGTIVAIPIANPPGYVLNQRQFNDGVDLNRLFPGKKTGTCSSQFVYLFFNKIIKQLEYLIDLHTASSGRVNSLFVRADMNDPISSRLAFLQNPQIVCHQPKQDKSVRGAAASIGIKSIAVEIGNPYIFQKRFIKHALLGVVHIMSFLKMIPYDVETQDVVPALCSSHTWLHTDVGGLLTVYPPINTWVKKGQVYGVVHDIFGNVIKEYKAVKTSIIVGKATSPVNQTGDRMILFGVVEKDFVKEGEKRIIGAGE
jgi:predicted deacylase